MAGILDSQTFILIWVGFLLLMSCGIGVFFLWGIRTGQFADQDRARYLPLQSGIPPVEEPVAGRHTIQERCAAEARGVEVDGRDAGASLAGRNPGGKP